jgi:hypothetical protein
MKGVESRSNTEHQRDTNNELGTLVPQHLDQHVMARYINRRSWNKKINPHLTGSTGIDRGKEERT